MFADFQDLAIFGEIEQPFLSIFHGFVYIILLTFLDFYGKIALLAAS